jgi:general secretion pathway protein L
VNLATIYEMFLEWCGVVAKALIACVSGLKPARTMRLTEVEPNGFTVEVLRAGKTTNPLQEKIRIVDGSLDGSLPGNLIKAIRGSHIEVILKPDRFLFRPIELPKRAAEFLHGILRAQIDRLTPWNAREAAFGWTKPNDIGKDRIVLTVVSTAQSLLASYLRPLTDLGAGSVVILTRPQGTEPYDAAVEVFRHGGRDESDIKRLRNAVAAVIVILAVSAGLAVAAGQIVADALDGEQQGLDAEVSRQRALLLRAGADSDPALRALERRKRESPLSVVVIEALSQILPDHTHLTELRVEADRVQLIGITSDAPSLVRLIEQSPHFMRATFFAPTTRAAGDPGERFHIEARINPISGQRT